VVLGETRAMQQIRGPHLVRPDGTVGLGVYGSVNVDNLTIPEAKAAIENYLAQYLVKPEISLDVAGFNSKVFYVVTDGAVGASVARLPITGKMTVLDAISQVNGLSPVSSKCIRLVRPTVFTKKEHAVAGNFRPCASPDADAAAGMVEDAVYPVHWNDIVRRGDASTNYQVLPGDRIYVMAEPLIKFDTYISLFLAPFERSFADVGLGNTTVRQFLTPISQNGVITGF
jgi:polysaccharide export outer membrane protein